MAYSINKFNKLISENGFHINRFFTIGEKIKLIDINIPESDKNILVQIPDSHIMIDKTKEGIKLQLYTLLDNKSEINPRVKGSKGSKGSIQNPTSISNDLLSQLDAIEIGTKMIEESDIQIMSKDKNKDKSKKKKIINKDLLEALEIDISDQQKGKTTIDELSMLYDLDDLDDLEELDLEEKVEENIKKEKKEDIHITKNISKKSHEDITMYTEEDTDIENISDEANEYRKILLSEKEHDESTERELDQAKHDVDMGKYNTMVYKNIAGGITEASISDYSKISISGFNPLELKKRNIQLLRLSSIMNNIDYELCKIYNDYLLLTRSGNTIIYTFINKKDEDSLYIVIDLEIFLDDMDNIHKELPFITNEFNKIVKKGINVHANTITEQMKNVKTDYRFVLRNLNKKYNDLDLYIIKYRSLIKLLLHEEESLKSKLDNSSLYTADEDTSLVFKVNEYKNKLNRIYITRKNIYNIIRDIEAEKIQLLLITDGILYDNILLIKSYTNNRTKLNHIFST